MNPDFKIENPTDLPGDWALQLSLLLMTTLK